MECRSWWAANREEILRLLDVNLAVDKLMWDAIESFGLAHLRRRQADRGEILVDVLGRYHRAGHSATKAVNAMR
jgi:hypothetical protein